MDCANSSGTLFPWFFFVMSNFEAMIDSVIAIDGSKSRSDVLLDLEYTKSAEETINRIFDGKVSFFSFF